MRRPNGMNRFGAILSHIGFDHLLGPSLRMGTLESYVDDNDITTALSGLITP